MNLYNRYNGSILAGILLASMTACSHGPTVQEFPDTASPRDEVARLDSDLNLASRSQVDVLAPHNFRQAQEALANAKKSLDSQEQASATLHEVAEGRAYLDRSNQFATLSHTNMESVVSARQQALTAGASQAFSGQFQKTDDNLKDVTSDLERNDLKSTEKNRSALQMAYLDLELKAIDQTNLGPSRDKIAQAINDGAGKFAPRTLAQAEKSVQSTSAYITANRHETVEIRQRSDISLANADHVLKITHDSKTDNKTSSEETALQVESEQNQVQDGRFQLADKQIQLDHKQNQLEDKRTQLIQEQGTEKALVAKNQKLESDESFNRSFEEARAEFTESEAQVYKQGNTLMIRLRGLEFPVNQAVLKGSNFPLLAKVQKVIQGFGKSTVVVEGHTDSIGGKTMNEKLSSDRAQAVKEYLQSNAGTDPVTITAVGYDYQKPLASNKTSVGRAQNRRVDVLIQPERNAEL